MKRYEFWRKDELEELQRYRDYCEKRAMRVLNWTLHLRLRWKSTIDDEEVQKKKDYFLYKYYEYQFDLTDRIISNLCAYAKR